MAACASATATLRPPAPGTAPAAYRGTGGSLPGRRQAAMIRCNPRLTTDSEPVGGWTRRRDVVHPGEISGYQLQGFGPGLGLRCRAKSVVPGVTRTVGTGLDHFKFYHWQVFKFELEPRRPCLSESAPSNAAADYPASPIDGAS